ncbi:MAG: hypothetical protein M3O70_26225 [Actinomycetota bacterium]|nr:hypothetical protein [Actinomycetota bacterium]
MAAAHSPSDAVRLLVQGGKASALVLGNQVQRRREPTVEHLLQQLISDPTVLQLPVRLPVAQATPSMSNTCGWDVVRCGDRYLHRAGRDLCSASKP